MSGEGSQEEGEGEGKGTNLFNNDGSFMEQFMKMQQEKSGSESKTTEGAAPTSRSVSMKLAPIKKKSAPTSLIQKRIQSRAVRKAFSDGENETASTDPSATPSATVADVKSSASPPTPAVASTSTSSKVGGRKRKSKWDMGAPEGSDSRVIHEAIGSFMVHPTSASPTPTPSGQQLTPAQLEQIKEQVAMQKMVAEIKSATQQGASSKQQNQYEYDSDEDTEGGTWEHKARTKEMKTTEDQAKDLTEMGKGKHHIGDFLPPEELEKFVETVNAVKEDRTPDFSDYKEHKLTEDNIGFKLLQKSGWDEGTGLGAQQQGITAPVNKGKQSFDQSGVGAVKPAEVKKSDDEFDLYRKRMMLAYRFRPNPLNNPRRPYY